MFLRASEPDADIEAAISDAEAVDAGVVHGAELRQFALAVVGRQNAPIEAMRGRIESLFGFAGLVDAAATIAMFNSINRVADATGTQLEQPYAETTASTTRRFDDKGLDISDRTALL